MRSLSVGAVSTISKAPPEPDGVEEELPVCDFCQKGPDSNAIGEYEELLYCRDCEAKGKYRSWPINMINVVTVNPEIFART